MDKCLGKKIDRVGVLEVAVKRQEQKFSGIYNSSLRGLEGWPLAGGHCDDGSGAKW